MVACPACRASNDDGSSFCARCGAPLATGCAECGAALPDDARFCPKCGTPVRDGAPAAVAQERRLVTILFADLVSSTDLGERLDPEHLGEVLDRYFAAMREEIEAEGGTVEKFIGDAVVAAFGIPLAHEDDASRALRAALRMRERLVAVNEDLARAFPVRLEIRVGVNMGEVLATIDPAPGERMFTGDAVNTAARFEQLAGPGQILTSHRTVRAAPGFEVADAGTLDMKGKAVPIRAFEVLREGPAPERGVPGLSAPMVGRDAELELLASLLARVSTERRPHLVTVYGDPGVGKSRLTQEFLATATSFTTDAPRAVLRGRCLPYGDGVTYWPLAEILKGHAGVLDSDAPATALERIRAVGSAIFGEADDARRATAALAFTMGLDDLEAGFDALDPTQIREQMSLAWRRFFGALAADGPVVAVVEDIHWADPALLDLLEQLAEWIDGPVLFLCPARPELLGERPTWGGGKRNYSALALEPLTETESEHLIRALLDIEGLPPDVHRRILERAGGNPFFLEEIVRQLVDGGLVVRRGERWHATGDVETVVIPDTVQAVLAARIDLLEPTSRRVLQAAAVVGRVFWTGAVASLLNGDGAGLDDALAALTSRDLVRPRPSSTLAGESELIFKHVLTRDVAYETLPRAARAEAHATVARWIEATVGERQGEFVELLAYHFAEAHRAGRESASSRIDLSPLRRRAFDLTLRAARDARQRSALRRAERYANQALDLADGSVERSLAQEALAATHFVGYEGDEAWAAYRRAIDEALADSEPDALRVSQLCAAAVAIPTRFPGSMRIAPGDAEVSVVLELGIAHLPAGDSRERIALLAARASWPFAFAGLPFSDEDRARCEHDGLEAAESARRLGMYDLMSSALDDAAGPALSRGRYTRALEIERMRIDILDRVTDPLEVGDAYAMMAWCLHNLGRYREALDYVDAGLPHVRGVLDNTTIHLLTWRINASTRLGDWDAALTAYQELLERLGDRRDEPPNYAVASFAAAASIHERRDEHAEAAWAASVVARVTGRDTNRPSANAWAWETPLLVILGTLDAVRERIDARLPGWEVSPLPYFEGAGAWVAAAEAWERAPGLIEEMRAFASTSGCAPVAWEADLLAGRAAAARGDDATAVEAFEAARSSFAEAGAARAVAVCDVELAAIHIPGSPDPQTRERLAAATALFERLRSVRDLDRVRALGG